MILEPSQACKGRQDPSNRSQQDRVDGRPRRHPSTCLHPQFVPLFVSGLPVPCSENNHPNPSIQWFTPIFSGHLSPSGGLSRSTFLIKVNGHLNCHLAFALHFAKGRERARRLRYVGLVYNLRGDLHREGAGSATMPSVTSPMPKSHSSVIVTNLNR
ncbi:hypothetical protein J6590_027910 [Homalodisca vitripennis]|nr:hypothetical protein J6590_027910 [Homalodisca vitripennis]